jgi:hypothetical protein
VIRSVVAAGIWLSRSKAIEQSEIVKILDEIPKQRMTELAKEFTLEPMMTNQQRFLEESAKL